MHRLHSFNMQGGIGGTITLQAQADMAVSIIWSKIMDEGIMQSDYRQDNFTNAIITSH